MNNEIEDDFDRFCRIGKGSISGPSSNFQRKDFLSAPSPMFRNRAGSLRENRQRTQRVKLSPRGSLSRNQSPDGRRYSLTPNFQDAANCGATIKPRHSELQEPQSQRARPSSFRSMSIQPMKSLPPINVYAEEPPGDSRNIVRVRSFRRTKNGVISEGDRVAYLTDETLDRRRTISTEYREDQSSLSGGSGSARHGSKPSKKSTTVGIQDRVEVASAIRRKSCSGTLFPSPEHSPEGGSPSTRGCGGRTQFTVQVLGAAQVGKTTMCTQFLTSESLEDGFDSANEGSVLETVTVDVDGEQTSLVLIEEVTDEDGNIPVMDSADAYLVVYAVDDRESFRTAQTIISEILGRCKIASAIVLVANKADLVRARTVTCEEGRNLASVYSCGFYEVSISLNHQVNELLVGLVSAIKSANHHVEEERERLSRIASLKAHKSQSFSRISDLLKTSPHNSETKRPKMPRFLLRLFKGHFVSEQ